MNVKCKGQGASLSQWWSCPLTLNTSNDFVPDNYHFSKHEFFESLNLLQCLEVCLVGALKICYDKSRILIRLRSNKCPSVQFDYCGRLVNK